MAGATRGGADVLAGTARSVKAAQNTTATHTTAILLIVHPGKAKKNLQPGGPARRVAFGEKYREIGMVS
jgi:hypothetical protein